MAVVKEALGSRLQVVVQTGTDAEGQPVLRTRSYAGVSVAALDSDVYDVALAIGALQQHTVHSVRRIDEGELVNVP